MNHSLTRLGPCAAALAAASCCPSTAGPTAPAASYTVTLEPGTLRYFDAETPQLTTQINLTFRIDDLNVPLQLRQIDPGCLPTAEDNCPILHDSTLPPRPAGVVRFGNILQPRGSRTRIVLRNPTEDKTIDVSLTIAPYRAGCT